MGIKREPIGEILRRKFSLTPEQLEEGLRIQKEKRGRIGEILVRLKYVREEQILEALALQLEVPYLAQIIPSDIDRGLAS